MVSFRKMSVTDAAERLFNYIFVTKSNSETLSQEVLSSDGEV